MVAAINKCENGARAGASEFRHGVSGLPIEEFEEHWEFNGRMSPSTKVFIMRHRSILLNEIYATSHSDTACIKPRLGSRVGINSCPT